MAAAPAPEPIETDEDKEARLLRFCSGYGEAPPTEHTAPPANNKGMETLHAEIEQLRIRNRALEMEQLEYKRAEEQDARQRDREAEQEANSQAVQAVYGLSGGGCYLCEQTVCNCDPEVKASIFGASRAGGGETDSSSESDRDGREVIVAACEFCNRIRCNCDEPVNYNGTDSQAWASPQEQL